MKDNQRKRGEQIELFLFVVVLAVFAAVIGVVTSGGKKQAMEQMRILSSGWYYMENGEKTEITLPTVIKAENGEPLTLYNDGITGEDAGKTISTRGAQYDLMISLNGKILYEYQESSFKRNTQMKSKLDCDGEFPVDLQDGTLILTYSQPQHGKYEILPVYIGSGRDVAICHFLDSMGTMGSAFCFIILSVIALADALYLRYRQIPADRFRDVALFLMICGIWLITDSSLVQSYSSHPDIICIVSFYMFMMLAVPAFCTENRGYEEIRDSESGNFLILYQCSASGTPELSGDFPVYTDAFCNAYSFVGMGTDLCHTFVERIQKRAETGDPYGHDRIYDSRSLRDRGIDSVLAAEYFLLWNHLWNRNPYFPDPDHSGYNCKHGEKYPLPYRNAGV